MGAGCLDVSSQRLTNTVRQGSNCHMSGVCLCKRAKETQRYFSNKTESRVLVLSKSQKSETVQKENKHNEMVTLLSGIPFKHWCVAVV